MRLKGKDILEINQMLKSYDTSTIFIRQCTSVNIRMALPPNISSKDVSPAYMAYVRRGYVVSGNHLIRTDKNGRKHIVLMALRNLK